MSNVHVDDPTEVGPELTLLSRYVVEDSPRRVIAFDDHVIVSHETVPDRPWDHSAMGRRLRHRLADWIGGLFETRPGSR